MTIYISTSCLKNNKNVIDVLGVYENIGLKNIELGSSHMFVDNIIDKLKSYNFNFIVHNYFPPSKNMFVMNLSSQNSTILKKTLGQIKNAIRLCNELDGNLYSFHPGFTIDPLNLPLISIKLNKKPILHDKAVDIFINMVQKVNAYAEDYGVKIAVENHVATKETSKFLIFYAYEDFEELFKKINSDNLGTLIDFGHLKVTSYWMNFDKYDFIDKIKEHIFAFHIHDNNSISDEHKSIRKTSWFMQFCDKKIFKTSIIVLESVNLNSNKIIENKKLLENMI
jgi:sugar phosphate isomerase/epimerase